MKSYRAQASYSCDEFTVRFSATISSDEQGTWMDDKRIEYFEFFCVSVPIPELSERFIRELWRLVELDDFVKDGE
jgi:hypothetical protein